MDKDEKARGADSDFESPAFIYYTRIFEVSVGLRRASNFFSNIRLRTSLQLSAA